MGAGILPVAIYKKKVYFLFGKEVEDGKWGDFGGGTEPNESKFKTAIREGYEELDGFLGSQHHVKELVNSNYITSIEHLSYKVILFKLEYDNHLPIYFKNHHQFIKKHFPDEIKKNNGLFEKSEISWWSLEDIKKGKYKFHKFYRPILDLIIKNAKYIQQNV